MSDLVWIGRAPRTVVDAQGRWIGRVYDTVWTTDGRESYFLVDGVLVPIWMAQC